MNVHDILKKRRIKYPQFGFLENMGSVIKIMQWQPKGILSFSEECGFRCSEPNHARKAQNFIEEAYSRKADIVITPEYSFPWSIAEEVIENENIHPKNGKIYCLGMEGISGEKLKDFISKYNSNQRTCFITEDMNALQDNYFFSCLLYLFKVNEKIICLIQFKTTPASDQWSELESKGLTRGKTIYLFKSMTAQCYMFSYICADVLNQEIESFRSEIPYQECLILHPQLNPKPRHQAFEQMRGNYLNYDGKNTRIIGINWAKDTVLPPEGARGEVRVEESVSACFYNGDWNKDKNENINLIRRNKAKGIDLTINQHILIWYMPDDEHCMFYTIDCFSGHMLSNVTGIHKEPLGDTYYQYSIEKQRWISESACRICRIDWDWLQENFHFEPCKNGQCNNSLLVQFFSILLTGMMVEDPDMARNRIYSIMNKGAIRDTALLTWREKCQFVDAALCSGKIPRKFKELANGNYMWILNANGNLTTKEEPLTRIYNVMYVNSSMDCIVEKCRKHFLNNAGDAACDDRLIIYCMTINGIQCYEKFYNNRINDPDYTSTVNSIL